ncbi:signal transduction histidine kinase [Kibdelosporangium banguiense]|uniref:histidine kinase n=1 Tax=Kibdelosporangium banguiense TaxID=1365924 RepID=A0ABS4TSI1_9PSEU|nr:sensor histidine kinase [Kibdelosporangium banguiense]MBP2327358.1 signal transduction histidine kinase [Kibdelosporangium banguiense]
MPGDQEVWQRPPLTPEQKRADVWLALAAVACAVMMTVLTSSMGIVPLEEAPSFTEQLAWGLVLTVPLVMRRRFPLVVLFLIAALYIAAQSRRIGDNLVPSLALFIALYSAGVWAPSRTAANWARISVIVAMFGWMAYSFIVALSAPIRKFPDAAGPLPPLLASVIYGIVFNLMFFIGAYYFGNVAYLAARRRAELEQRAEELRLSQEQNTRGAIVAERVRIARDLHDVVAHHVSVMGVQAGAARRVFDKDPVMAQEALQTVEKTARVAIGELRGLLGVLRAEDSDVPETHPPSPGLDRLPELVSSAKSAGIDVEYGVFGETWAVPEAVALSAYRVVQEALTNVVKHAGAKTAHVRIRYLTQSLEVEVTDDGRSTATTSNGFGLVGMRERVAVHSGELEAGPRRDGGYRVRVSFPKEPV